MCRLRQWHANDWNSPIACSGEPRLLLYFAFCLIQDKEAATLLRVQNQHKLYEKRLGPQSFTGLWWRLRRNGLAWDGVAWNSCQDLRATIRKNRGLFSSVQETKKCRKSVLISSIAVAFLSEEKSCFRTLELAVDPSSPRHFCSRTASWQLHTNTSVYAAVFPNHVLNKVHLLSFISQVRIAAYISMFLYIFPTCSILSCTRVLCSAQVLNCGFP